MCEFAEELTSSELLVTALVVVLYFVRTISSKLHCHTECHVLSLEVFAVADMITKQHFRIDIHHFIDIACSNIAVFSTVVIVEFSTVAIP